mmetsp:Transcript_1113/g.3320  ORF Transcript_1113/g.3320 Transcript_1113/m.3320 type:complete len:283 (-) Transcript_1113:1463-2311(-)
MMSSWLETLCKAKVPRQPVTTSASGSDGSSRRATSRGMAPAWATIMRPSSDLDSVMSAPLASERSSAHSRPGNRSSSTRSWTAPSLRRASCASGSWWASCHMSAAAWPAHCAPSHPPSLAGPPLASSVRSMTTAASRASPCRAAARTAGLLPMWRQPRTAASADSRAAVSFAMAATRYAHRPSISSTSHSSKASELPSDSPAGSRSLLGPGTPPVSQPQLLLAFGRSLTRGRGMGRKASCRSWGSRRPAMTGLGSGSGAIVPGPPLSPGSRSTSPPQPPPPC